MAKVKPVRKKPTAGPPSQGLPCLILIVSGMVLFLLLVYLVLRAN